jgi:DNA-binding transcriptional LysR family regulator
MDSTAQIEQIAGHRIDLGFIGLGLPNDNPELEIVAVAEERLVAGIPQDHRLAHKSRRAIPLKALAAEPGTATAPHACGTTATRPWRILSESPARSAKGGWRGRCAEIRSLIDRVLNFDRCGQLTIAPFRMAGIS